MQPVPPRLHLCPHADLQYGSTAPHAGLRNLSGQYVTSVRRGGDLVHAVGSEFVLAAGDVLYLSGKLLAVPLGRCQDDEGVARLVTLVT